MAWCGANCRRWLTQNGVVWRKALTLLGSDGNRRSGKEKKLLVRNSMNIYREISFPLRRPWVSLEVKARPRSAKAPSVSLAFTDIDLTDRAWALRGPHPQWSILHNQREYPQIVTLSDFCMHYGDLCTIGSNSCPWCSFVCCYDATTHLYKSSCPSVRSSVGSSVPCDFQTTNSAVFEGKNSSNDIIINDTMSADKVVASDVPPRYFLMMNMNGMFL